MSQKEDSYKLPTDQTITTAHLAKLFKVSQRTIQRWLKDGKLDSEGHLYRTAGGHWRIGQPPKLSDLAEEEVAAVRSSLLEAVNAIALLLDLSESEDEPKTNE